MEKEDAAALPNITKDEIYVTPSLSWPFLASLRLLTLTQEPRGTFIKKKKKKNQLFRSDLDPLSARWSLLETHRTAAMM